jgi:hypothetical protein
MKIPGFEPVKIKKNIVLYMDDLEINLNMGSHRLKKY